MESVRSTLVLVWCFDSIESKSLVSQGTVPDCQLKSNFRNRKGVSEYHYIRLCATSETEILVPGTGTLKMKLFHTLLVPAKVGSRSNSPVFRQSLILIIPNVCHSLLQYRYRYSLSSAPNGAHHETSGRLLRLDEMVRSREPGSESACLQCLACQRHGDRRCRLNKVCWL